MRGEGSVEIYHFFRTPRPWMGGERCLEEEEVSSSQFLRQFLRPARVCEEREREGGTR